MLARLFARLAVESPSIARRTAHMGFPLLAHPLFPICQFRPSLQSRQVENLQVSRILTPSNQNSVDRRPCEEGLCMLASPLKVNLEALLLARSPRNLNPSQFRYIHQRPQLYFGHESHYHEIEFAVSFSSRADNGRRLFANDLGPG